MIVIESGGDSQYSIVWFHLFAEVWLTGVFYMQFATKEFKNLALLNFVTEWADCASFVVILSQNVDSLAWWYFVFVAVGLHAWILPMFLIGSKYDKLTMLK